MFGTETGHLTPPVSQNDHVEGPDSAPVTLVEYGDFECPYCGEAAPWVDHIRREMGSNVRFAFRNFPLPQHPYAEIAAEAAEAAGAQGKFWQMHDILYRNQNALDPQHLVRYAQQIGLDTDQFVQALENHTYRPRVEQDEESGNESGVQGTPWFFINGEQYQGPLSEDGLAQAVQQAAS